MQSPRPDDEQTQPAPPVAADDGLTPQLPVDPATDMVADTGRESTVPLILLLAVAALMAIGAYFHFGGHTTTGSQSRVEQPQGTGK